MNAVATPVGFISVPLFTSAHAAIRFAVTRQGSAASPLGAWINGPDPAPSDLAGMDGAAQAGMIMNIIGALGPVPLATLVADVAPRTVPCACRRPCCSGHMANTQWRNAIDRIAQAASYITTSHVSYALRSAIVVKLYTGKKGPDLKQIADELRLNRDTVGKYHGEIHRWLKGARAHKNAVGVLGIEPTAWSDAETLLTEHGIVGRGE